jgi:hypothetical protein
MTLARHRAELRDSQKFQGGAASERLCYPAAEEAERDTQRAAGAQRDRRRLRHNRHAVDVKIIAYK